MSFLPLEPKKTYILLFTRVEEPASVKAMSGYNHMALGWMVNEDAVFVIEPTLRGASIDLVFTREIANTKGFVALIVDVESTNEQRLFREHFQTCATMVQYLAGFDLGATLVQTLYEKLTTSSEEFLKEHGILGVETWEWKP